MTKVPTVPAYLRRNAGFHPDPRTLSGGVERVPTLFGVDGWLVTRQADVRAVLADWQRFTIVLPPDHTRQITQERMSDEDVARERAGRLLSFDPPEHTRLRRLLAPAFTSGQVRRLQPWIERIVEEHLDAMEQAGPPLDLVQAFALPIPLLVICELLGVPYEDRAEFNRRSSRPVDLTLPPHERRAAFLELRGYMADLAVRAGTEGGDGMLATLAREYRDDLSLDELAGIGHLMLVAGHETTANMLALGTLALLRHPDQLRVLLERPERVEAAVEELLRWISVVTIAIPRVATEAVEIGGQRIEAGEVVIAALPAANRDPALVPDPDILDLTRGETGHLAFGHGIHHCLGAPLARAEMQIAYPALLRRFPSLHLADPEADIPVRFASIIHGVPSLPVAW